MINEIDPYARVDSNGVITADADNAWMMRLEEWLRTAIGSVYGAPHWGSPLADFKHEPMSSTKNHVLEVAIENAIAKKLRQDMPEFALQGIECDATNIDLLNISFVSGNTQYQTQVPLTQG